MKTYLVRVKVTEVYYIPVEAESETEACFEDVAGEAWESLSDFDRQRCHSDSDFEVDDTSVRLKV
jgi:hypothetical protein